MKNRTYHGISLSKRQFELVTFLLTGSHDYKSAYFIYPSRKRQYSSDERKISSWFNKTLSGLHRKNLCTNIPFVNKFFGWKNPGIEASKANLVIEQKVDFIREIVVNKPVL